MRTPILVLAFLLGACASAGAQPAASGPTPMWRMHTEHLAADRVLVRSCLNADHGSCERVVQDACLAGVSEDDRIPALERQCDWRAMAAWEDETAVTIATLRAHLDASGQRDFDAAQRAWQTVMLDDVGIGMSTAAGGSLEGQIGAHIRAREEARRGEDLEEIARLFE